MQLTGAGWKDFRRGQTESQSHELAPPGDSLASVWPVHLCYRRFPTCRTFPCMAGRWSGRTARLWRRALPADTAWCCRFYICDALPDSMFLCTLDCRLLKSKKSKKLGFLSDVWACFYAFMPVFFNYLFGFWTKTLNITVPLPESCPKWSNQGTTMLHFQKRRKERIIRVCYFTNFIHFI